MTQEQLNEIWKSTDELKEDYATKVIEHLKKKLNLNDPLERVVATTIANDVALNVVICVCNTEGQFEEYKNCDQTSKKY